MNALVSKKSIYVGFDRMEFDRIRDDLENLEIRYKYNIRNRMAQMTGGSAARARQQIAEAAIEHMYVYEIFIHRRDYDRYLLAS